MTEEKNGETVWFKCELGCPCLFLTKADLEKHYHAFKTTGYTPNAYDHKVFWQNELKKRDHEYIGEEGW